MGHIFEHINILIIPTNACNLRCEYCFHNEYIMDEDNIRMTPRTIEKLYEITFPFYKSVNIIWHGGEPLCMGLNFFREVMKIQNKCNTYGASIINSVQTNLTLMTPEYIRFFTENKFGISTSFDGLKNEDLRHNTTQFFEKKQLLNDNGENVE